MVIFENLRKRIKKYIAFRLALMSTYLYGKLVDKEYEEFKSVVLDKAETFGLSEEGKLRALGTVALSLYLTQFAEDTTHVSPSDWPNEGDFIEAIHESLCATLKDYFEGGEGRARLRCAAIFIMADSLGVSQRQRANYGHRVRHLIKCVMFPRCSQRWIYKHFEFNHMHGIIEYANAFTQQFTLYGYSIFHQSLPKFARSTIPDIKGFIRLRGLKK